jgi:hypothetical protein
MLFHIQRVYRIERDGNVATGGEEKLSVKGVVVCF